MLKLFALLLCAGLLTNCQSLPHKSKNAPLAASYLSGLEKFAFHDVQRKKTLEVLVWYPVLDSASWVIPKGPFQWNRIADRGAIKNPYEPKPLIVFSHGFGGGPEQFNWLIEPLVAAGYMVLATRHADFPTHLNHWNRSLDVTFILNEFLNTPLGMNVDKGRIGFAGYSLGGMTGISVAGAPIRNLDAIVPDETHVRLKIIADGARSSLPTLAREEMQKSYRDVRIKAAFLMAPAWSWIFYPDDIKNIDIPIYIVAAEHDEVVVSETNGLWYSQHIPKAQFQWIRGAGHFVFLGIPTCEGRAVIDPDGDASFLYKDNDSVNRNLVQEQVRDRARDFFDANL